MTNKIKKIISREGLALVIGMCLLISGCETTTSTQEKYKNLEVLYKSGKLTAEEYADAKQKILQEDLVQAKAMAQADNQPAHSKKEHSSRGL